MNKTQKELFNYEELNIITKIKDMRIKKMFEFDYFGDYRDEIVINKLMQLQQVVYEMQTDINIYQDNDLDNNYILGDQM